MKQNFQLSINKERSYIAYAETENSIEKVIIRGIDKQHVKEILLSEIVFISWISNSELIIQTNTKLIFFDMVSDRIKEGVFLNKKIGMVLKSTEVYFDYITQLTSDIIEFYRYYFKTGLNKSLFSIDIYDIEAYEKGVDTKYDEYFDTVVNILDYGSKNIFDSIRNRRLQIVNEKIGVHIILNDSEIMYLKGHIDRAYVTNDLIIVSYSNFLSPRRIYIVCLINGEYSLIDLDGNVLDLIDINNLNVQLVFLGERHVPTIKISPKFKANKSLLSLHGGPDFEFRNEYIGYLKRALNLGYIVNLVDYSGSTGYGRAFYESLTGSIATEAIRDLKSIIDFYYLKNHRVIVVGESFGGYLSVVCAINYSDKIYKAISINGFTDYRYQYLFSVVGKIIPKYFDLKSKLNNPIDMLEMDNTISPIVFIHGENDTHCPIKQIELFCDRVSESQNTPQLIRLRNQSHYCMNLEANELINRALITHL